MLRSLLLGAVIFPMFLAGCAMPDNKDTNVAARATPVLEQTIRQMNFRKVEIEDVIQFLRDVSGASIYVNWNALAAAGIGRNTTVNIDVNDVALGKALRLVLDDVGASAPLDYVLDEGVIVISTADGLSWLTVTKVYRVDDLLHVRPPGEMLKWVLMRVVRPSALKEHPGARGPGTRPTTGAQGRLHSEQGEGSLDEAERHKAINELIELIKVCVALSSRANPVEAVIYARGGQLVITQTTPNHRLIENLLNDLRAADAASHYSLGVAIVRVKKPADREDLAAAVKKADNVLVTLRSGAKNGNWSLDRCAVEDVFLGESTEGSAQNAASASSLEPKNATRHDTIAGGYHVVVRPDAKKDESVSLAVSYTSAWVTASNGDSKTGARSMARTNSFRIRAGPGARELIDLIPCEAEGGGVLLVIWRPAEAKKK